MNFLLISRTRYSADDRSFLPQICKLTIFILSNNIFLGKILENNRVVSAVECQQSIDTRTHAYHECQLNRRGKRKRNNVIAFAASAVNSDRSTFELSLNNDPTVVWLKYFSGIFQLHMSAELVRLDLELLNMRKREG